MAPLARPAVIANSQRAPSLPKVRRAALTQSDAKLYAQTQVCCAWPPKLMLTMKCSCEWAVDYHSSRNAHGYLVPFSLLQAAAKHLTTALSLQGLVPMMNTPHSTPSSALQSIGTVCWPFQKGDLPRAALQMHALLW